MLERQRIRLVPLKVRQDIREMARLAYIEADGDPDLAIKWTKERIRRKYGSILTALMLLAAVLSVVVELIKLWDVLNIQVPERGIDDATRKVGLLE